MSPTAFVKLIGECRGNAVARISSDLLISWAFRDDKRDGPWFLAERSASPA